MFFIDKFNLNVNLLNRDIEYCYQILHQMCILSLNTLYMQDNNDKIQIAPMMFLIDLLSHY